MKSRKKVSLWHIDTFASRASFVSDVTDADCWAQNGSTHSNISPLSNIIFQQKGWKIKQKIAESVLFNAYW